MDETAEVGRPVDEVEQQGDVVRGGEDVGVHPLLVFLVDLSHALQAQTRQLRSASWSMKSNSREMSYVMERMLGFIRFRCSS